MFQCALKEEVSGSGGSSWCRVPSSCESFESAPTA